MQGIDWILTCLHCRYHEEPDCPACAIKYRWDYIHTLGRWATEEIRRIHGK